MAFAGVLACAQALAAQEAFPTPEAAAQALVEAARNPGQGRLDQIFGPGARDLFASGDEAADRRRLDDFLALAGSRMQVADGKDGAKVLVFGTDGWQFPVPLQANDGKWVFNLAAGHQEIVDRTVGRNELAAIEACADFVVAQQDYFSRLRDDEPVQQYARRFLSTPGRHDGLFWPPETPADRSPLGDKIAAAALNTPAEAGKPRPYKGYIYRILTRQGASAPGGAYDYLVKGRLLAGFAMLAYPERWGETGVMTFLCDQRGGVYEANFGAGTTALAARIDSFDPAKGWSRIGE
ncbi:DUF2950 domain-containing protein [Xanthobacter flavus]|uniref:DUF2950 domain-containing protein n=1 Tax=Xanthobacter flavus TaxID=281 RepID=UPI003727D0FF